LKFCDNCGALCKPHPKEKKYVCPKCGWSCELDVLTVSRRLNPEEKIVVVGHVAGIRGGTIVRRFLLIMCLPILG